ncbi:MAG: hypothetical protein ACLFUF_03245, partial [Opitutales bacterium]
MRGGLLERWMRGPASKRIPSTSSTTSAGSGQASSRQAGSGRDALTPKVRLNAAQRSVTEQGRPALVS